MKGRLACVPQVGWTGVLGLSWVCKVQRQDKQRDARRLKKKKYMDEIDFPSLLEHFQEVIE